jgi:hypothetical protein
MGAGIYTPRNAAALARAVFATERNAGPELRRALAHAALNRYLYEREIDPAADFVAVVSDADVFDCWADPRSVDGCETDARFEGCFAIAKGVLKGEFPDPTNCSRRFHPSSACPLWATGLVPAALVCGYFFYNNCD